MRTIFLQLLRTAIRPYTDTDTENQAQSPYIVCRQQLIRISKLLVPRGIFGESWAFVHSRCSSTQVQHWILNDTEVDAINHCVETAGCLLYDKVKQKEREGKLGGYLRMPLQETRMTGPGQEMVLEIWLKGGASPIHHHGDSAAIIKVLHGTIQAEWFNPLSQLSQDNEAPIRIETLRQGNYTWMLSDIYQTHRLRNAEPDTVSITLQAYGYEDNLAERLDYFGYLDASKPSNRSVQRYYPEIDMLFENLKDIQAFYENRTNAMTESNNARQITSSAAMVVIVLIVSQFYPC